MAVISESLRALYDVEGIYSNDPDDSGGETIFGIARKHWPKLYLWHFVDSITGMKLSPMERDKAFKNDGALITEVANFYRREFWDMYSLDLFTQRLADEIFEQSVNLGTGRCTRNIQTALNILNKSGTLWEDVKIDGNFGATTLRVLRQAVKTDERYIIGCLNLLQGTHYLALNNEKYIRGWIKRAQWLY